MAAEIKREQKKTRITIINQLLKDRRKEAQDIIEEVTQLAMDLENELDTREFLEDGTPNPGFNLPTQPDFIGMTKKQVAKEVKDVNDEVLWTEWERKINKFMYRILGKEGKVNGTRGKTRKFILLNQDRTQKAQIDNLGMFTWEDGSRKHAILFVVECKLSQDKNGKYGGSGETLQSSITKLTRTIGKLRGEIDAVRSGRAGIPEENKLRLADYKDITKSNLRYVGILALSGIKLSKTEKAMIKSRKFKVWDDDFYRYFDDLSKKIGKYAKYDMLGDHDMQIENPDKDPPMAFCLMAKMKVGNKTMPVYQFLMDPKKLLKIATVARRERPMEQFYQRKIEGSRLNDIADYFKGTDENPPGYTPNNIIIGMEPKMHKLAKFKPVQFKPSASSILPAYIQVQQQQKNSKLPAKLGTLTFPRPYRSCWIIDGQHRLYGIVRTREDKEILRREVKLPILAFGGMKQDKMADMFLDINDKQKRISSDLKFDLYAEYKEATIKGTQAQIVKDLDKMTYGDSPLVGRISYPSQKEPRKKIGRYGPHAKKERTTISAMYDALNSSNLATPILVSKGQQGTKPRRPIENPLQRGFGTEFFLNENHRHKVTRDAAKLIGTWYTILDRELPDEAKKGISGILYQRQVCKLWLPLLREIVAHEGNWPTPNRLTKYVQAIAPWVAENSGKKSVKDAAAKYSSANRKLQEMAVEIRKDTDRKLKTFGNDTGLLSSHADWNWAELLFAQYIQSEISDWENLLTRSEMDILKEDAHGTGKEVWQCLGMKMTQKILADNDDNLDQLANDFIVLDDGPYTPPAIRMETASRKMTELESLKDRLKKSITSVTKEKFEVAVGNVATDEEHDANNSSVKNFIKALGSVIGKETLKSLTKATEDEEE